MALSLLPGVALVALVALVAPLAWGWDRSTPTRTVWVTNGGPWGRWGDPEFCPGRSFAIGFQLKVEENQGYYGDDTALNGVRLICDTGTDTVTSSTGPWGGWGAAALCPCGEHFLSFRLRVEEPQGTGDDTAANDVAGLCSGGTLLSGRGLTWGTWGPWSHTCPLSYGVCGVQSRVEPHQGDGDDTALNDVRLLCCHA